MIAQHRARRTHSGQPDDLPAGHIPGSADMIDGMTASLGFTGRENIHVIENCPFECLIHIDPRRSPRNGLVEVPHDQEWPLPLLEIPRQAFEIGKMVLPPLPVSSARAYVCGGPGDADANAQ